MLIGLRDGLQIISNFKVFNSKQCLKLNAFLNSSNRLKLSESFKLDNLKKTFKIKLDKLKKRLKLSYHLKLS